LIKQSQFAITKPERTEQRNTRCGREPDRNEHSSPRGPQFPPGNPSDSLRSAASLQLLRKPIRCQKWVKCAACWLLWVLFADLGNLDRGDGDLRSKSKGSSQRLADRARS